MIRRTLKVLAVIVALVPAPYYLGKLIHPLIFGEKADYLPENWTTGLLMGYGGILGVIAVFTGLYQIYHYIVKGTFYSRGDNEGYKGRNML